MLTKHGQLQNFTCPLGLKNNNNHRIDLYTLLLYLTLLSNVYSESILTIDTVYVVQYHVSSLIESDRWFSSSRYSSVDIPAISATGGLWRDGLALFNILTDTGYHWSGQGKESV